MRIHTSIIVVGKYILGVLGLYAIGVAIMYLLQRDILFPRQYTDPHPSAGVGIADLEKLWIESEEGPVESWFLPGEGVHHNHPGPVVLFAHGNAELIEYWPDMLAKYRKMGVSLFLPEFRGYGRSAGIPSEKAITEDFIKFYDLLVDRPDVDVKRIVFHGRSMGGGAVCALAAYRKPQALILQSTFTSIADMSWKFYIPGFVVEETFDNLAVVKELDIPILIIHGKQDDLIPFQHAEKLYQASRHAELIAYDCDHNTCPPDWEVFWQDIRSFLRL